MVEQADDGQQAPVQPNVHPADPSQSNCLFHTGALVLSLASTDIRAAWQLETILSDYRRATQRRTSRQRLTTHADEPV